MLGHALATGADVSRPAAALARAEALARGGEAAAAAAQLRAAALEPVGRADQPWALVPRYRWQLREAGETTDIEVHVPLPDSEAHRLPAQRDILTESIKRLAAQAAAAASPP